MSRISRSVSGPRATRCAQRLAVDEFRDQEPRAVVIADLVDGQDVRVIERRRGARFVQETAQRSGSPLSSGRSTLSATGRPSVGSTAL